VLVVSYAAGSIPFAWLIAKAKGVDIRTVGSGNVGATNVARSIGPVWGVLTFVLDAVKGAAPALVAPAVVRQWTGEAAPPALGLVCGLAAVAGHTWPVFLRFKGGKGVATSAGVLLAAAPGAAAAGLAVWLAAAFVFRYVSVASIAAAMATPLAAWILYGAADRVRPGLLTAMGALIIWRHRSNVERLLAGTEPQIGGRKSGPAGVVRGD